MESILSCKVASRGWHFYGKNTWKRPRKDDIIFAEKERNHTALEHDVYSIAWKKKTKSKLTADVVGHVPKEISRAVFFFISRGGKVVGKVFDERCYPSPIPKGGLEILLMVQFKIPDEKRKYMERLKEIIKQNYTSDFPEGIEIENHEKHMKTVEEEEQSKYDSDSDHVIDDDEDDEIICID